MQRLLSGVVAYASGFLQGEGDQEPTVQTEEGIIYEVPGSSPSTERQPRNTFEQGDCASSRKRPPPRDSLETAPKKKVDRRSHNERRLMGDYSAPNTAQPIRAPRAFDSDEAEELVVGRRMVHKPSARGHRPMDTLGCSPHAATGLRPNDSRFFSIGANKNQIKRPNPPRQSFESVSNRTIAATPTHLNGDGFEMSERTARSYNWNKRPRLDVASTNPARPIGAVDLTGEDDVEVIGLNGRGLPGTIKQPRNGHAGVEPPSQPFQATEFKRVSDLTSVEQRKRKRKSKDGQGSSQTSSHGTPADAVNGYASTNGQLVQETLDAELKNVQPQGASGGAAPRIDLTRGWDDPNRRISGVLNAPSDQLQKSIEVMNQFRRPHARATRGSPRGTRSHQNTHRTIAPQSNKPESKGAFEGQQSPRLSEQFKRDEPEPKTVKMNAKQRMKARSQTVGQHVSPSNDRSDSADELAGETTVGSQASRSGSPQKGTKSRFGNAITANGHKRSSSPSDLQPAEFTRGTRGSRKNIPSLEKDDRCKLQAFFATSCVLTCGDIEMRYDKPEKQFDIYLDGDLQVLRGEQMTVSIGVDDVSKVEYSPGKPRVHLRCHKTRVTTIHICIEFSSWENVPSFLDRLSPIGEDHLWRNPVDADRLERLYVTQSNEIAKMFKQQNEQRKRIEINDLARAKRGANVDEAEESIKYDLPRKPRSARQSEVSRLSKEAQVLQSSPYFQNSQPRRSSRKVKPIRSPSPPLIRWTEVNKPQRWAQSLVYPSEGVRRVTVDFQDLERLDEGEFLNDNIISFALRQIEESMAPELKQEVYFFNSFFYTALTTKNGKSSFNYDAVKRWTKNSDLLGYPYVVVPINNNLHWFVAIICNLPSVSRKIAGGDDEIEEGRTLSEHSMIDPPTSELAAAQVNEPDSASRDPDDEPWSRTLTDGIDGREIQAPTKGMSQLSLSQDDGEPGPNGVGAEGEGDNATAESSAIQELSTSVGKLTGAKKSKKRTAPPLKKYDPDQPTIIFLDSTAGVHTAQSRNLKDYLRAEAEAKRGMDLDTKQLQGMTAKGTPEQPNYSDCGLYLVGFVQQFANNPRQFVTKVLTRQLEEQADFAGFDASAKRDEIRSELLKLNEERDTDHKAKKSAKKANTASAPQAVPSSPTRAPRKSPKPVVSQTPALNPTTEAGIIGPPELPVHPTDPVIDPSASFDTGEEDLEVSVPRPLTRRPQNPATTLQEANSELPPAVRSPQTAVQCHDSRVLDGRDEGGSIAEQQELERMSTNASDEEMLDTADEPNEPDPAIWSDAVEPGSNRDLLQSLQTAVDHNLQELQGGPGNNVGDTNGFQASNSTRNPVRKMQPAVKHNEVIDLESQDAEPEVPESPQEKHQGEPQFRKHGRHTKFL